MNEKEMFEKTDIVIKNIISLLDEELLWLGSKFNNIQRRSDLVRGVMRKGNIYVPLKAVEHRILFDGYEYSLLETFVSLYKEIYENKENIFTEFSFRTLIELGFYRTQILYSNRLTSTQKSRYKSLILLADYASLAIESNERLSDYKKLYDDQKDVLEKDEIKVLDKMLNVLEEKDEKLFPDLVIKVRQLVLKPQRKLYLSTEILPIFKEKNIKAIYSAWSHILHGNVLLLKDLFSQRRKTRGHKLRAHWFLLMVGINIVNHTAKFTKKAKFKYKLKDLNNEFTKISTAVSHHWKSFE